MSSPLRSLGTFSSNITGISITSLLSLFTFRSIHSARASHALDAFFALFAAFTATWLLRVVFCAVSDSELTVASTVLLTLFFARVNVLYNACLHVIAVAFNRQVEHSRAMLPQLVDHFCVPAVLLLSIFARPVVQCQQICRVCFR